MPGDHYHGPQGVSGSGRQLHGPRESPATAGTRPGGVALVDHIKTTYSSIGVSCQELARENDGKTGVRGDKAKLRTYATRFYVFMVQSLGLTTARTGQTYLHRPTRTNPATIATIAPQAFATWAWGCGRSVLRARRTAICAWPADDDQGIERRRRSEPTVPHSAGPPRSCQTPVSTEPTSGTGATFR